uniref:Uncharacterized protein n=1 Tax=Ditylenchus dipsaci TaxID=166011 RepID=A0A915CS64_9BILA
MTNGQKKDEEKVVHIRALLPQIVQNSNDRIDAVVRLYNPVTSLKRSDDACGDMSSAPCPRSHSSMKR